MTYGVLRLRCRVQHYAWGDTEFIPALLGVPNLEGEPHAELWMGAHPDLPSEVEAGGEWVPLNRLIAEAPEAILGPVVTREFQGRLPYLFKVLSARTSLSIQAHPSKDAAREGFARENAAGVPLTGRNRSYRDDNHKPELMVALTDFYGLRGFRPLEEITRVLRQVPEFRDWIPGFEPTPEALQTLYGRLMGLPQAKVDAILDPLVQRLEQADAKHPFARDEPEHWLLEADRQHSGDGHRDRGLLSIPLLNLIHLRPGEAMYLPSGTLHAYLEGSGLEIMANSNNVLRGGLTPKHVDVPELLATLRFEGESAEILRPTTVPGCREWRYPTPAHEFELRRVEAAAGQPHQSGADHSAEIAILAVVGEDVRVSVESEERSLELRRGDVFLAPFGTPYAVDATGPATLYKATVPAARP
jgi:mannose-6-phosphate isomerase class I